MAKINNINHHYNNRKNQNRGGEPIRVRGGNNRIIESCDIILTPLQEKIDVDRTAETFSTSVEPVEEHLITEPIVSIEDSDALFELVK